MISESTTRQPHQPVLVTVAFRLVAVLLVLSAASCGSGDQSQTHASEFGARPTVDVETSEQSPANDAARAIANLIWGAISFMVCLLLGKWWSPFAVFIIVFIWIITKTYKYDLRSAARSALILSIVAVMISIFIIILCWRF